MTPSPDPLEIAKAARLHSRHGFLSTVEAGQVVRDATDRLHEQARRNHFGPALEDLFRRRT